MIFCFLSLLMAGAAAASESTMPSPPPQSHIRPNLALLGGIFAAFVSFIFLFLFYLKQRNRHGGQAAAAAPASPDLPNFSPFTSRRRHSGVEREMVERLPLFLFAALVGPQKEGLECAVCLSRFKESEGLRLLPKCRHAFHVECVDKWLEAHSSCPICRAGVGPEDVVLLPVLGDMILPRARHSSAGETSTKSVLRALDPREIGARRSVDYVALRKGSRAVGAECLGEGRKDVVLMERRFGHQIVVDGGGRGGLSLRSEMIITDCGRFSASRVEGRAPSEKRVNGERSMSEMTGLGGGGARWRMEGVVVEEPTMRRWSFLDNN